LLQKQLLRLLLQQTTYRNYRYRLACVKAQIHAGGRGKGGGVKLGKNLEELETIADHIIGMQLITPQTPPRRKKSKSSIGC